MSYQENGFVITEGRVNLVAGKALSGVIVCIESGDITVTWDSNETSTITIPEGMSLNLKKAKSAVVVSGTFLGS